MHEKFLSAFLTPNRFVDQLCPYVHGSVVPGPLPEPSQVTPETPRPVSAPPIGPSTAPATTVPPSATLPPAAVDDPTVEPSTGSAPPATPTPATGPTTTVPPAGNNNGRDTLFEGGMHSFRGLYETPLFFSAWESSSACQLTRAASLLGRVF